MIINDIKIMEVVEVGGKKIIRYKGYGLNKSTDLDKHENVVCYDENGEVVWKINGDLKYWDQGVDSFVGLGIRDNGELVATSFSGNVYLVDINTGKAVWDRFVK